MNYVYIWLLALVGTNILAQQAEKVITDTIASKSSSTLSQALAKATAFAINSDGTFAIAAHGRQVTFLNLDPQNPQSYSFPAQEVDPWQILLSKSGKKALFHHLVKSPVVLWASDGQSMQPYSFPEQSIWPSKILFSSDENSVTTLKVGVEPRIWDISNPHNIQQSSFPEQIGKIQAMSHNGTHIVTGQPGGFLLWNMGEPNPQSSPLPKQVREIYELYAVSPNRELAVLETCEAGDNVKLWNLQDGTSYTLPGIGTILAAAFTSDSSLLISRLFKGGESSLELLNCIDPQNSSIVFKKRYDIAITNISLLERLRCALLGCGKRFVDILPLENTVQSAAANSPSEASLAASATTYCPMSPKPHVTIFIDDLEQEISLSSAPTPGDELVRLLLGVSHQQ